MCPAGVGLFNKGTLSGVWSGVSFVCWLLRETRTVGADTCFLRCLSSFLIFFFLSKIGIHLRYLFFSFFPGKPENNISQKFPSVLIVALSLTGHGPCLLVALLHSDQIFVEFLCATCAIKLKK